MAAQSALLQRDLGEKCIYTAVQWADAERCSVPLTKAMLIPDYYCSIPTNIFQVFQLQRLSGDVVYFTLWSYAGWWQGEGGVNLIGDGFKRQQQATGGRAALGQSQPTIECGPWGQMVEPLEKLCGGRWNPHRWLRFWSISFLSCTCYSHLVRKLRLSNMARTKTLFSNLFVCLQEGGNCQRGMWLSSCLYEECRRRYVFDKASAILTWRRIRLLLKNKTHILTLVFCRPVNQKSGFYEPQMK